MVAHAVGLTMVLHGTLTSEYCQPILSNVHMSFYHSASVDYISRGPFDITFQPGSTRELFNVTIVDNGIPENSEFFNADIVSAGPAGVIIGEPRQPVIEILDRVDSK